MHGRTRDGAVHVEGNARERYYDSRGYGTPDGDALTLAPVEAAHLLYRGDLESVDGDDFRAYLAREADVAVRFLVYKDLRDRGFYLAPAERHLDDVDPRADADADTAAGTDADDATALDFAVFPRGKGPWDGEVAYRVRVVGERDDVPAASLGEATLAVVDEESEITYLETTHPDVDGSSETSLPTEIPATLLGDRAVVWEPPEALYGQAFYGQPLDREADALQLSLVEAAHLASEDVIAVEGGREAVAERGRRAEGERFDRRLAVYADLRERGVVPKTGFKFGADFRTYADVESVEDLGHSELLVRVLDREHVFAPRDLALDVRLAHGVRKTMVYAVVDGPGETVEWVAVERLTP